MQSTSYVESVNPFQGTDSQFDFSHGNCLPLISMPFGMTSWSPQTDEGPWIFHYRTPKLQGIRATHQPSPWIGDYGHFTIMPQIGQPMLSAAARASVFRLDDTVARPHYFKTILGRYRTMLELTPTERCARLRLTFPAVEQARVIFQPFDGESHIAIHPERATISGMTRANSGGCPENFACYFVAVFDRPFAAHGLFQPNNTWTNETQRSGNRVGAFVEFDAQAERVVELKIATSFISVEQARRNLEREIGALSFDEIAARGGATWNAALARVQIEGATEHQRQTFYSCLYRSLLFPRLWYEYDADGRPIHYSPYNGRVEQGVLYADNGFWDTFRTVYPLLALLFPERLTEMINGWIQAAKEGGWFPKWASPGYRNSMIGTHLDAVVADAYLRGIRDIDVEAAYHAMRKDASQPGDEAGRFGRKGLEDYIALGYVPADQIDHAAARTQEFAYTDFCVAQMAQALGHDDDYRLFRQRALNYRNVFDPGVGFMRARLRDGTWLAPFDEFEWNTRAYIEGSAWQYSWAVPHDPAGLIALHGGNEALVAKLEQMLALPPHFAIGGYPCEIHEMTEMARAAFGQYAHSNQPVHHVLYLFTCAGQPWKTQHWVRRVLAELYGPGPDGFPGDEDNGEMSAWYILNSLGIFPLCPGHPSYVLGSPLFRRATLHLADGHTLTIEGHNNGPEHVYVQQIEFNGAPYPKTWIAHADLACGGRLAFTMGDTPRTDQDLADEQLPFSLSHS